MRDVPMSSRGGRRNSLPPGLRGPQQHITQVEQLDTRLAGPALRYQVAGYAVAAVTHHRARTGHHFRRSGSKNTGRLEHLPKISSGEEQYVANDKKKWAFTSQNHD